MLDRLRATDCSESTAVDGDDLDGVDTDATAAADVDTETTAAADTDTDATSDRSVGLFVDGPNVLREEFDVDLDDVRDAARNAGRLAVIRLYLNEHATPGLIQAAEARGYEVIMTSGDVDVKLAVDATALIAEGRIDTLAIASRDTGANGVRTLAIAPGSYGRSDALPNAADRAVTLEATADSPDRA